MIYVVLPRPVIGQVMRGERTTLPVIDPAPIGAIVAVKVARNRRPTVLLTVTACEPDADGHILTVRPRPIEHEPLLLAADSSRGYTHDPRLAMRGEPEAIDPGTAEEYARRAGIRHGKTLAARDKQRRLDRDLLTVEQRMADARQAARLNHVDVRDEIRALKHMQRRGRQERAVLDYLQRIERIAHRDAA